MDIEDGAINLRQTFMHTLFQRLDLCNRALHGGMELPQLSLGVVGVTFGERVKVDLRMDNMGLADAKPRRGANPGQPHAARATSYFRLFRPLALIDAEAFNGLNHAGAILLMLALLGLQGLQ